MTRSTRAAPRDGAFVLLEDGTAFQGDACGAPGHTTGEVVFTTGMSLSLIHI